VLFTVQPEVGLPGCVTLALLRAPLLGPAPVRSLVHAAVGDNDNHTPTTRSQVASLLPHVLRQHFIGDVSPQADPGRFVMAGTGSKGLISPSLYCEEGPYDLRQHFIGFTAGRSSFTAVPGRQHNCFPPALCVCVS
jgi:hypothetical protein